MDRPMDWQCMQLHSLCLLNFTRPCFAPVLGMVLAGGLLAVDWHQLQQQLLTLK